MPHNLPPCPKAPTPEDAAASGDPYATQGVSIFACDIKGFKRWYDRQTWKFFDDEETLYLGHTPVRRRARKPTPQASVPGSPKAGGPDSESSVRDIMDQLALAKSGRHSRQLKREASLQRKKRKAQQGTGGNTSPHGRRRSRSVSRATSNHRDNLKHDATGAHRGRRKERTVGDQDNVLTRAVQHRARSAAPASDRGESGAGDAQSPRARTATQRHPAPSEGSTSTSVPAGRLASAVACLKAIKQTMQQSGDCPGSTAVDSDKLYASSQVLASMCAQSAAHCWETARTGGVGAILKVLEHTSDSLQRWHPLAMKVLGSVCKNILPAPKQGGKKGLKRSLKPAIVKRASAIISAACHENTNVPSRFVDAAVDEGMNVLRCMLDDMKPQDCSSMQECDYVLAGGLAALLLTSQQHKDRGAGKSARVMLARFKANQLRQLRDSITGKNDGVDVGGGDDVAAEERHKLLLESFSSEQVKSALEEEIERRFAWENRQKQVLQEQRLQKLKEVQEIEERRARKKKYIAEQMEASRRVRAEMMDRVHQANMKRIEEQKQLEAQRREQLDEKQRLLKLKRQEIDHRNQVERQRQKMKMELEAKKLAELEAERKRKNDASFAAWQASKTAQRSLDLQRQRKNLARRDKENLRMVEELRQRLKMQILKAQEATTSNVSESAQPPLGMRKTMSLHRPHPPTEKKISLPSVRRSEVQARIVASYASADKGPNESHSKRDAYSPSEDMQRFFARRQAPAPGNAGANERFVASKALPRKDRGKQKTKGSRKGSKTKKRGKPRKQAKAPSDTGLDLNSLAIGVCGVGL